MILSLLFIIATLHSSSFLYWNKQNISYKDHPWSTRQKMRNSYLELLDLLSIIFLLLRHVCGWINPASWLGSSCSLLSIERLMSFRLFCTSLHSWACTRRKSSLLKHIVVLASHSCLFLLFLLQKLILSRLLNLFVLQDNVLLFVLLGQPIVPND